MSLMVSGTNPALVPSSFGGLRHVLTPRGLPFAPFFLALARLLQLLAVRRGQPLGLALVSECLGQLVGCVLLELLSRLDVASAA